MCSFSVFAGLIVTIAGTHIATVWRGEPQQKRILFVFPSWKSLSNFADVPKDWNDLSLLLSAWLYHAHITPAMIKTNTGQRREEKETTRETKRAGRFEGGGAQTDKEWVRQADIHLHRGPSKKVQIMGKDCVRHGQTSWVYVLEVNSCEDGCMISLKGDSGCEAEVRATFLTSFNMYMSVPLRAADKDKVEGVWVSALWTHSDISPDGNLIKAKWNV